MAKHDFEVLAANTLQTAAQEDTRPRNLASSPLDSIDPLLYVRFPRFSTATESGHPDLSPDEVTSTRYSVDEVGIMQACGNPGASSEAQGRRQKLPYSLHKAISFSGLSMKNVGLRLKRAPSNLLRRAPRAVSSPIAQEQVQVSL